MTNKNMFLWWGSGSGPCWKAMLILEEKGLWKGCPNKLIEFSKKEHKAEDVTEKNPRGQMPTFTDGETNVNESGAICMYIEEKYSTDDNKLMPTDEKERAQVYQRMFESSNMASNIIHTIVRYKMTTKKEDWDAKLLKERTVKAKEELNHWNRILGDNPYLCGKSFTMADVFFYPFLAAVVRFGCTLSANNALKQYYDRVSERPSVIATWPPHWKGTEGPKFLTDL